MNDLTSPNHPVRSTFLAMEIISAPGRSTWVAQIGKGKATLLTLRGTRTRQRKAPLRGGAPQAGAAEGRGGLRPQPRVKKLGVFTDPIIILGYVTVGYG